MFSVTIYVIKMSPIFSLWFSNIIRKCYVFTSSKVRTVSCCLLFQFSSKPNKVRSFSTWMRVGLFAVGPKIRRTRVCKAVDGWAILLLLLALVADWCSSFPLVVLGVTTPTVALGVVVGGRRRNTAAPVGGGGGCCWCCTRCTGRTGKQ